MCVLFAGWEVHTGKNCLEYGPRIQAEGRAQHEGTVFPKMDQQITENYFRNICVDFLLKQFHTMYAHFTFWSSELVLFTVFKRRDSIFADFRTEQ